MPLAEISALTVLQFGVIVVSFIVQMKLLYLEPVSTGMGDHLQAGIPPWYIIKPTEPLQHCIPPGSLNRVPALIGWGKGGNITSAGWQVTLCDPIWHVSSRSAEALANSYTWLLTDYLLLLGTLSCS